MDILYIVDLEFSAYVYLTVHIERRADFSWKIGLRMVKKFLHCSEAH
jgi:hypothetical protein